MFPGRRAGGGGRALNFWRDPALRAAQPPAQRLLAGRLDSNEERHLEPLPVAIDVIEAEGAQPLKLGVHVERAVGRVLVLDWLFDRFKERQVQAVGRRCHVLEVREYAAGLEQVKDLAIERALAIVLEMMDRKRRDDSVEAAERGQRL